ncbi:MAG: hypothetical protein EB828_05560 [Nitrosopumilus sp. D6]|nr:MAG: hypothetical protein EB828_05560 [Nitrosopumilus sp. D6]
MRRGIAIKLQSARQYVDFFLGLDMGDVRLLDFIHNERMALKQRLKYKDVDHKAIDCAISVLETLAKEIKNDGENIVIARHASN